MKIITTLCIPKKLEGWVDLKLTKLLTTFGQVRYGQNTDSQIQQDTGLIHKLFYVMI